MEGVDCAVDAAIHRVGRVQIALQFGLEARLSGRDVLERPVQAHAGQGVLAQIDVSTAVTTGDVVIGLVAHLLPIGC